MHAAAPEPTLGQPGGASQRVGPSPTRTGAPPKAMFILEADTFDVIYGPGERRDLERLADFHAPPQTRATFHRSLPALADTEVIFSGWGAPVMDAGFLAEAPRLRAVFYGAGSIRGFTTEAFWERDIVVTSAYAANAVPVAEYVLGTILLSLKHFWRFAVEAKAGAGWGDPTRSVPGAFRATVGLVSFGMIARRVRELLRPFDLDVLVSCPFLSPAEAADLGVEVCPLDEIFRRADVVSLHTPQLPETVGMIAGSHFSSMKPGATFINSARGAIVRQTEMIRVLRARPDLTAVLDVCDPEPAPVGAPWLNLPNLVLTPHIAGSLGPECRRLGRYMVAEFERYLAGEPLRWQITREQAAKLA